MSSKVLIVTIALGEKYIAQYNNTFRESQEAYARKNGYDFKVVTDFLETELSGRHTGTISFQKILVGNEPWSQQYDKIVYLDADVFVNIDAPPIHSIDTGDKIGMVNEYYQPSYEERLAIQKRKGWEANPTEYYKLASEEFVLDTDKVLNTGVFIIQPRIHKDFLYGIYAKHVANAIDHPRKFHFEQSAIGYEIQKHNMYHLLDNKWNAIWVINLLAEGKPKSMYEFYKDNYFLHFAGGTGTSQIPALRRQIKLRKAFGWLPFIN